MGRIVQKEYAGYGRVDKTDYDKLRVNEARRALKNPASLEELAYVAWM